MKVYLAMILGIAVGLACFIEWVGFTRGFKGPIQSGRVLRRDPVIRLARKSIDFTIQIEGRDTVVHAFMGQKAAQDVPDVVRFHFSGDQSKRVVLFEHEESMLKGAFVFWGMAAALWAGTRFQYVRRSLGWEFAKVRTG